MKKRHNLLFLALIAFLINSIAIKSQTNPFIKGTGIDIGTVATTEKPLDYEIKYDDGAAMDKGFVSLIKWSVEGGTITARHPEKPLVTVKWNKGQKKGVIYAKSVFSYTIKPSYEYRDLSFDVWLKDEQTEPEPDPDPTPTDFNPHFIQSGNADQYRLYEISIDLGSSYTANSIQWTIEGETFSSTTTSKSHSFLYAGKTTVKAKIKARRAGGYTQTAEIQQDIYVNTKAPYIDKVSGIFVIGPRGSGNYFPSPDFSKNPNIKYTWSIYPDRDIVIERQDNNDFQVRFTAEGYHSIYCKVEDTKTGLVGNQAIGYVTVDKGGILRNSHNENIYLEAYNANTGVLAKREIIHENDNIQTRMEFLPKGLYIVKIRTAEELIDTKKILIK